MCAPTKIAELPPALKDFTPASGQLSRFLRAPNSLAQPGTEPLSLPKRPLPRTPMGGVRFPLTRGPYKGGPLDL